MSLLDYLPPIYRDPTEGEDPSAAEFLARFLWPFERVMLSRAAADGQGPIHHPTEAPDGDRDIPPIEEEIAGLHRLFDAETTPEEFLPWLAGWVALALRTDLPTARQRALLANTVRLYRIRGTRCGIEEVLKLYLDALPSVTDEDRESLQIVDHSTVGVDTYLGGGASFLFQVKLAFSTKDSDFVASQRRLAREVLELERPAYAWYELEATFPKLQVSLQSTVGVDTLLAPWAPDLPAKGDA